MGDEPVADPDAMWKAGYSAPAGEGETDDPAGDVEPQWFANYGRSEATAAPAESSPPAPEPAPTLAIDGVEEIPDDPPTPRPRIAPCDGCSSAPWRLAVVAVGGVAWQIGRDGSTPGRHVLASIPERGVPTWIAELDTGHVTGVIGTRSTIAVLELVTNDLVGLSAASGTERWRVHAAPSHSIAQLEEVDGAAIVLVEESTGDRSIAAYDLDSGERVVA